MAALKALQEVNKLVEEESKGDSSAHAKLLKSIRNLQLAVETPLETTSRLNFQVSRAKQISRQYKPSWKSVCLYMPYSVLADSTEHL